MDLEGRLVNWGRSRPYDEMDQAVIAAAWCRLSVFDQQLLRLQYQWGAPRGLICRRLNIRQLPPTFFDLALARAHAALARELEKPFERNKVLSFPKVVAL